MKKILLMSLASVFSACLTVPSGNGVYNFSDGTVGVSKTDVEAEWLKHLNKTNESFHDAVVAAMLASKKTGREVFVQKKKSGNQPVYYLSYVRGDAENVLGYTYKTRYVSFNQRRRRWIRT